jgi:aryl-alcohol dehydrogenase-like predicted oxidoreductase
LDLGVNYFDTADVYARGAAEEMLGKILSRAASREDVLISTKVYYPMGDGVNNRGLSRKHITDSVDASLKRLRVEYIDLYVCHRFDDDTPLVETAAAMQDLIHRGKILHWGVCDWTTDQVAEAASKCKANGWIPPAIAQVRYSLMRRTAEDRFLSVAEHHGLGVVVASPLEQGLLTGKYAEGDRPGGSRGSTDSLNMFMREPLRNRDLLVKIERMGELAAEEGLTPAQLSLIYVLDNPSVDSVIVGATSGRQLEENSRASGPSLPQSLREQIVQLFT